MTIIQPDTSTARERTAASVVISGLRKLLRMRYLHTVSRVEFLQRWGDLRVLLKLTPEYQKMLRIVFARDKICTKCGASNPTDPHHKIPVSRKPERACDPGNVEVICHECHVAHHSPPPRTLHPAPKPASPGLPSPHPTLLHTGPYRAAPTFTCTMRRQDV